jgi:TPP-dependent pyruvate/acetoin dehydrogenase alpha subunit
LSETAPYENPLVPNKKLRQIFTAMAEMQLLDEHIAALQSRIKGRRPIASTRGQEACRVSTAIELKPGDLVSDAQASAGMDLLFGAKPDALLRHIDAAVSTKRPIAISPEEAIAKRQLPWIDDVTDRLKIAMGAALTFRTLQQTNIVVAYIYSAEVSKKLWQKVLSFAAQWSLPMIFVVLPGAKSKDKIDLCAKARAAGIPGIPVDASDAVALYRVAQESIGRTRGGDGPVLIACIADPSARQRKDGTDDPILHMKSFLVGRKICTEAWANHAGDAFRRKIAARKLSTK